MPVRSRPKSIYYVRLKVENARCFAETQELRLVDSMGAPARWTLLVGENGVGKTTLLQCLSWMRPTPQYATGEGKQTGIQPLLHDQDPDQMARLLRNGARRTTLRAKMVEGSDLAACGSSDTWVTTGIEIEAKHDQFAGARLCPGVNEPTKTAEPFVITYGANRYMGHQNADKLAESQPVDLLRTERTELVDAADVFSQLEYSALKGNTKSRTRLNAMKGAVAQILPWIDRAGDIDIQDPEAPGGALRFRTRNGNVPLDGLSLGHRSVMTWIVDLAWRLIKRYPDSTNPLQEPAVVLIDEVDLHVHPVWQRRIMADLSRQFTNVQFVATTQSPLLITSMKGVNVAVLGQSKQDRHIIIENDREVDEGWRFDHVLVNLFGLKSARSLRVENLLKERAELVKRGSITPQENERLGYVADELAIVPAAERQEDQELRRIVLHAAAGMRDRHRQRK